MGLGISLRRGGGFVAASRVHAATGANAAEQGIPNLPNISSICVSLLPLSGLSFEPVSVALKKPPPLLTALPFELECSCTD